jgi:hypothetical protein
MGRRAKERLAYTVPLVAHYQRKALELGQVTWDEFTVGASCHD